MRKRSCIMQNIKSSLELAFSYRKVGDTQEAIAVLENIKCNDSRINGQISFFIKLYKQDCSLTDIGTKVFKDTSVDKKTESTDVTENIENIGLGESVKIASRDENIETSKSKIESAIYKNDFEACFWAAGEYFRKYYSDLESLNVAEKVYKFLLLHSAKLSQKFYEDYLYAARTLSSHYLETGKIKESKELSVVDSFSIKLPVQKTNGNDILSSHLSIKNNPCFTQEPSLNTVVVWGNKISLSEMIFWNKLFASFESNIEILFLAAEHDKKHKNNLLLKTYSSGGVLEALDAAKETQKLIGKVALIHSGLRLSPSILGYFLYFKPHYNFVITPKFDIKTKKKNELISLLEGVNNELDKVDQSKFHMGGSLLCSSFDIGNIKTLAALENIHHLKHCSTEFFWRLENQGAYFVQPHKGFVELVDDIEKTISPLFKYSHSSTKILCELYPLAQERKRNRKYKVPLIDIYIPMYNAEKYIASAIESCLNQTIKDIRICISNDGSTDNCVDIVEEFQKKHDNILLESHDNAGISITTMSAIGLGDGLVIAQLDSDDTLKPDACETLIDELLKNEKMGCVYGSCERIDAAGNFTQKEYSFPEFSRQKMLAVSICHHFRMWKRKYYNRTSHFNPFIVNGIDYDFFSKLTEITDVKHIDKILYQRRWHGENTSIRRESDQTRNTYICMLNSLNRQGLNNVFPVSPFPKEPRKIKFAMQNKKPEILKFPDYSYSNPYQNLLYKSIENTFDIYKGDLDLAIERTENNKVFFHLHWLNFILNKAENENHAAQLVDVFLLKIKKFTDKGGKLIWTIHNNLEHDQNFVEQDIRLRAGLCALSNKIHLHDIESLDEVFLCNPVPREKLIVHAHGNYIGSYGDFDLKIREKRIIEGSRNVVFVGQLRKYKGLQRILAITTELLKQGMNITIAGQPENADVKMEIEQHFKDEKNITLALKRIPNNELHELLLSNEFGLLSYENILTSGSLRLFQSYAITPIAPDLPLFKREIINGDTGYIYKNDTKDFKILGEKISNISSASLLFSAKYNYMLAQELDWAGELISYFDNESKLLGMSSK
jgi:glycosyltransferase involved in cell wall biosynthesis